MKRAQISLGPRTFLALGAVLLFLFVGLGAWWNAPTSGSSWLPFTTSDALPQYSASFANTEDLESEDKQFEWARIRCQMAQVERTFDAGHVLQCNSREGYKYELDEGNKLAFEGPFETAEELADQTEEMGYCPRDNWHNPINDFNGEGLGACRYLEPGEWEDKPFDSLPGTEANTAGNTDDESQPSTTESPDQQQGLFSQLVEFLFEGPTQGGDT